MPDAFSSEEARVIACLIEKSVNTPDLYPMTLNSLTNACNQKSGRVPIMSLDKGTVQRTIRILEAKHLVRAAENFKGRAEKYSQRFCNTRYSQYQFDPAQLSIICVLLLRGPQTPGELRSHSGRLHSFEDNAEVVQALTGLIERDGDSLLVKLPRTPGRKDAEYMHLFCGPVDVEAHVEQARTAVSTGSSERISVSDLAERVSALEAEVAELRKRLSM